MKVRKHTRNALVMSIVSLLLCVSMLVGTTFAWFTDEVQTGMNTIAAGNLDVELLANGVQVDSDTKLFGKVENWEPGVVVYETLQVKNVGTLALKYQMSLNFGKENDLNGHKLSEVLKVAVVDKVDGATRAEVLEAAKASANIGSLENFVVNGELEAGAASAEQTIVIFWEPNANEIDNLYNANNGQKTSDKAPLYIEFGVELQATQKMSEEDSFGSDYDEFAFYNGFKAMGSNGGVVFALDDTNTLHIGPYDANDPKYQPGNWKEAVVYENGVPTAIGGYPYTPEQMNEITALVLEEGITTIGSFGGKFVNLTGELVIPSTCTYIGQEAFQNTKITKLTFAEGGTEPLCIAPGAFKNLQIEEVVFPSDRPAHIHCWAFNDNAKLKSVVIPHADTTFLGWTHVDYMGMGYVQGYDSQVFSGCNALESITFGNQKVHDAFFNAAGNQANINAIGNVQIIVK